MGATSMIDYTSTLTAISAWKRSMQKDDTNAIVCSEPIFQRDKELLISKLRLKLEKYNIVA